MADYVVPQSQTESILTNPEFDLSPWGLAELAKSGISKTTAEAHKIRCMPAGRGGRDSLLTKVLNRTWQGEVWGECLMFPYLDGNLECVLWRVKPEHPYHKANGEPLKYLHPTGANLRMYFTNGTQSYLASELPNKRVVITEGEKKALALCECRYFAIGLPGVCTWHKPKAKYILHSDLQRIHWRGVEVWIVFDSDAERNEQIRTQRKGLAEALTAKGAIVHVVKVPDTSNDPNDFQGAKFGIDDILVRSGPEAVRALLETTENWLPLDKPRMSSQNMEDVTKDYHEQLQQPMAYYAQQFYFHDSAANAWGPKEDEKVEADIYSFLTQRYQRIYTRDATEVRKQLTNRVGASSSEPPCWLGEEVPVGFENPEANCLITKGCVVNLETGATTPNSSNLFTTYTMDVTYDPKAPKPERFMQLLQETFGDEVQIRLLLQHIGRSLTATMPARSGRPSLQKILMILGFPGSGKSTILRIWEHLLGPQNVASVKLADLESQFGAAQLPGKQLIVVPDCRSSHHFKGIALERLCNISGEDAITVEKKGVDGFTTRVNGKLLLIGNALPHFNDISGALARRLHILQTLPPDPKVVPIDELSEHIYAAEASGILKWAIEGWLDVCENGFITPPEKCLGLLREQRELNSPITAFIEDNCLVGEEYKVTTFDLFGSYTDWCEMNKHQPLGSNKFGAVLRSLIPNFDKKRFRGGERGTLRYYYLGLMLRPVNEVDRKEMLKKQASVQEVEDGDSDPHQNMDGTEGLSEVLRGHEKY